MRIIADLHLHSRYARATSKDLTIQNMEKWGRVKGLGLMGTGDAQHPKWLEELQKLLNDDDGDGIYRTSTDYPFMLQSELSFVFTQQGKGRRVHLVTLFPDIDVVRQVQEFLLKKGRIDYDGRPIFKMDCAEVVDSFRSISHDIEVIPAHIWTPWFSMFGSESGFDSVNEAFGDQAKHIHAVETGLSSDPPMNWRLKQLDGMQIVSFSDSHSHWPWRIGREATIFETKLSYDAVVKAICTGEGLKSTIEYFPEEGKYHYDGHRTCGTVMEPSESRKRKNICPACGKKLTIGVMHRVEDLADREASQMPGNAKPFKHLIPLSELIAARHGTSITAKKVFADHDALIKRFGDEFSVLLDAAEKDLGADPTLAAMIIANREGRISFKPGYDGTYGEPDFSAFGVAGMKVHHPEEKNAQHVKLKKAQQTLGNW